MITEESLLHPLPYVSPAFLRDLAQIATYGDKPLFRLVDGLREQKWRNGKMDVKHLFTAAGSYKKVFSTRYRRKFWASNKFLIFRSYDEAQTANVKGLTKTIEVATKEFVIGIGRPCWIVEVYVKPEEICYDTWVRQRYQMLEKNGVVQKIDQLGPYPVDGLYIACFDVIDSEGNAVSPSERTLDECRRRLRLATEDTETVEMAIQGAHNDVQRFEAKQLERMNDEFQQHAGITATRARAGVVGRPIAVN